LAAAFKDHFSERAAGYASHRPHYTKELVQWLASIAPSKGLVWDVACGSGQLSELLGDEFAKVIATDASSAQIEQAKPHPHVEYRVEPAEHSSLADHSADLITVAQAVHWLNLDAFYIEARRVARPGAVLALVAYHIAVIDPEVDAVIDQFYSGDLDGYWPPERKHIETEYRDIPFPFERIATAERKYLSVNWDVEQMLGYIRTWSAVRALEKAKGAAKTDQFADRLRTVWRSGIREVRWPLVILAGKIT
jgi:ubiquinone/menaquinone biosynthesis C-methylase UbiE